MANDVRTTASSWGLTSSAYEKFSEDFSDALYHCVKRLNPQRDEAVLDVATGTGWTARLAATRGANVTGIEPTRKHRRLFRLSQAAILQSSRLV